MVFEVQILSSAKLDIKKAANWYNQKQQGLGLRFTNRVRKTVQFICQNPNACAVRYDNVRTSIVEVFPYMVHYKVDEDNKIVLVLAVLHTSRDLNQ